MIALYLPNLSSYGGHNKGQEQTGIEPWTCLIHGAILCTLQLHSCILLLLQQQHPPTTPIPRLASDLSHQTPLTRGMLKACVDKDIHTQHKADYALNAHHVQQYATSC